MDDDASILTIEIIFLLGTNLSNETMKMLPGFVRYDNLINEMFY